MESLNLCKRDKKSSHSARKERRKGKVPGIIYGEKIKNFMFEIGELDLNSKIKEIGEHGVVNVNVDGSDYKALIKEVQRHPINHNIIHIDLEQLSANQSIITEIPIFFNGEGKVKSDGGILQKEKNSVKIQCNSENIPKSFNINLSGLQIGDAIRVGDVEVAEEITFMEPLNSVIVSVTENSFTHEDDDSEDGLEADQFIE